MSEETKLIDCDSYKYKKTDESEFGNLYAAFLKDCRILKLFKEQDAKGICFCWNTVSKIIEQVRKRKLYFHIYHDTNGLSEIKEVALYAFWVLKLQPFLWLEAGITRSSYALNSKIALNLFVHGLRFYADKKTENSTDNKKYKVNITKNIIDGLYHSFMFRDISKEALMDIAESLITEVIPCNQIVIETQKQASKEDPSCISTKT